ncbi:hypothetical protein [Erythrobacter sp. Alg231-14]|uniref:hypothetical protein n=1 Tax=Erythrobacter sp. Alg231-14 TaxID=1922225 RepID=UPI000D560096
MDVKSSQATGNAAMHFAAWQLSRRGWNVMPTARNAKGSDLFCANDDESIMFGVQSKGLSKRYDVSLGKRSSKKPDVLDSLRSKWWIITVFANDDEPRCFILNLDEVQALAVENSDGSHWLPSRDFMVDKFEDAWHRLESE